MPSLATDPRVDRRLAGAPISWGVCEVPGWGVQLPPERVLAEMAELGLRATELGPVGYLPAEPAALRATLGALDLDLVGGFVPLVLHEPSLDAARRAASASAAAMAAGGADVFVAAVVMDAAWSAPRELSGAEWARLASHLDEIDAVVAEHGLSLALHPHAGTLVETAADIERVVASTEVGWCLDTGHLLLGGADPEAFLRDHGERVVHVHLKDVDAAVAARYRSRELSLLEATRNGLFRPLGDGSVDLENVLRLLDADGYDGWLVLEQDVTLDEVPPPGGGPRADVARSLEFLAGAGANRA